MAIESGNSLAEAFNSTAVQLKQLKTATLDRTREAVSSLNTLTKELPVNDKIGRSELGGLAVTFDLRDKRIDDFKLRILHRAILIGVANVTIGASEFLKPYFKTNRRMLDL